MISIDTIVDVQISRASAGINVRNINNCCIFSNETPKAGAFAGTHKLYVDARSVATDFGSASKTATAAQAFFAQTPNPLSTQSPLAVYLTTAANATATSIKTVDISANIANFKAITDGSLKIGTNDVTGLDFSSADTIDGVSTIISNALFGLPFSCSVEGQTLVFRSFDLGAASAFTIAPAGTGTDITAANLLNIAAATTTAGTDSTGETLIDAVNNALNEIDFVGVITTQGIESAKLLEFSNAFQAIDNLWILNINTPSELAIALDISTAGNTHTRCLYYSDPAAGFLFSAAYMGRAFSVNFSGTGTVQDMHLKALATILPDRTINGSKLTDIRNAGCDCYVDFGGLSRVFGSLKNGSFDQIYNVLALKFQLQASVFNLLATTFTKIPQTEAGMESIKSVIVGVMEQFTRNGYMAAGAWSSNQTFGDPVTFRRNIEENGYYIYSLPVAQQAQAERDQRIAPLIQIAVKEAGSINHVTLSLFVEA